MIRILKYLLFIPLVFILAKCGKNEEPKPMYTITGSVSINDIEYWPQNQQLMFGLFLSDERQPEYSLELTKPSGTDIDFELKNVSQGNYIPKVYIAENTIFKAELVNYGEKAVDDNLSLQNKAFSLVTYKRVQEQLFNSCVLCHGNSTEIAAELNLNAGQSYDLLVNMASKNSTKLRVKPFDVNGSFLIQVLYKENLSFDHSASTTATPGDIELIENWIEKGAAND